MQPTVIVRQTTKKTLTTLFVVVLIAAIIGYRFAKIFQKQEQKRALEETVVPRTVWDIQIPEREFVGDMSQFGNWLLYEADNQIFRRDIGKGITEVIQALPDGARKPSETALIGRSQRGKREFRIEEAEGQTVIAQYHVSSRARGLLARLPRQCAGFKRVSEMPNHFFVLEGLCQNAKRIISINLEDRRLTYASPPLPLHAHFIAMK